MNSLLKRTIVVLLLVSMAFCAAGCKSTDVLDEKVVAMIDCNVAHEPESGYDLLYPGVQDREEYIAAFDKIDEYFPVTAGYTWVRQKTTVTKGSDSYEIIEGQYKIEFDGQVFHIYAAWRSDLKGSGFVVFRIFNEDDWSTVNKG